ncbi:VOC family protein [Thermodesulfobacteriota bacterium]
MHTTVGFTCARYKLISVALFVGMALCAASCDTSDNHITRFVHANINCSDLVQSRNFYEMLGFAAVLEGDAEVTAAFAAALNMPPYTLSYVQMLSGDGSLIDLIEWKDPYDDSAPYSAVNHLGIARLTLQTADLHADIITLSAQGVEFFSEPVTVDGPAGRKQFVVFKDPDGTIIELVESDAAQSAAACDSTITGIMSVNINCSNYEQSRLFYENLGFSSVMEFEDNGSAETAAAFGMPSYHVRGARMELRHAGPALSLLEWENPYDNSAPYAQLNHLGIARIALRSTDLDADITRLKAEGVAFFSDPVRPDGALSFMRVVFFKDPDGTVIELVEMFPGFRRQVRPLAAGCP